MNEKCVWLFKETRSGSDWLWRVICEKLHLECEHVDMIIESHLWRPVAPSSLDSILFETMPNFVDIKKLYSTHQLKYLPLLQNYNDPFVIRSTRRNKAEQCMSILYGQLYGHTNKHFFTDESKNNYNYFNYTLENPIYATKQQVKRIMQHMKTNDEYWQNYSHCYENFLIVYEDLFEGITIPYLEISLNFKKDKTIIQKSPDYKTKAFLNYSEIVDWCNEYENSLNFMKV